MTAVALFNDKSDVGKTTLAYHLAHMMSRLGVRVLAVDLDPQANLTAHFLGEAELEGLWEGEEEGRQTVAGAVQPIVEGIGDISLIPPLPVAENLYLLPGDLALSRFEERLAQAWPSTLAGSDNAAVRATTAFHRLVRAATEVAQAEVVLVDVGPNLGALNRSALLLADHVIVPLGADLFSAKAVLGTDAGTAGNGNEIATVRNYRSLMPLALTARKPMFDLRAADGAIGSTQRYVQVCFTEFRALAEEVLNRLQVRMPTR